MYSIGRMNAFVIYVDKRIFHHRVDKLCYLCTAMGNTLFQEVTIRNAGKFGHHQGPRGHVGVSGFSSGEKRRWQLMSHLFLTLCKAIYLYAFMSEGLYVYIG